MPNLNDVMFILGEQNTQLDNLVGLVKDIKKDRKGDIEKSNTEHKVIIKKINNHILVDHNNKLTHMNWLTTLRKYSLKAAGVFVFIIFLMAIPEAGRVELFKILEGIKNLFI